MPSNSSFVDFLSSIASRGRTILGLPTSLSKQSTSVTVVKLCHELLTSKGDASGIALSFEVLTRFRQLDYAQKTEFFLSLYDQFSADQQVVTSAAAKYLADSTAERLSALTAAVEPPRSKLIIRLNQAPNATYSLLGMRSDLLKRLPEHPKLEVVDRDFVNLFASWFNGGFLELRNLTWSTSASLLEKIIEYEAVHGITDWNDLRRRIDPPDRRIYGFFHPRLGEEPLIFVEVALSNQMPFAISSILDEKRQAVDPSQSKTATFYSISNCQDGLRRIPLGSFLIKQVVEDLKKAFPSLKEFVTLSPVPGFSKWVKDQLENPSGLLNAKGLQILEQLAAFDHKDQIVKFPGSNDAAALLAHYLCKARNHQGLPRDPVARFHLGNGAGLERINWAGDLSDSGFENAYGMMVNYVYRLDDIEQNHEKFVHGSEVIVSATVRSWADSLTIGVNKIKS